MNLLKITLLLILGASVNACATFRAPAIINKQIRSESYFYRGQFERALDGYRSLVNKSQKKNRLLYLLEAGTIMHVAGEYDNSNLAFIEADAIAEKLKKSIGKEINSFFLSDLEQNFTGESFDRVLIKMYIALNYLMMNDEKNALNYFRKMNYELQEMKYTEASYRQNHSARYLYGLLAESIGNYNRARVQYNNMVLLGNDLIKQLGKESLLILEQKEKNAEVSMINHQKIEMEKVGGLVVIIESGKAAIKKSRGKLKGDPVFDKFLENAVIFAIATRGANLSHWSVLNALKSAENPIPYYEARVPQNPPLKAKIFINGKNRYETDILSSYSLLSIENFNEQYQNIVQKNVASIATKVVTAIIASEVAGEAIARGVQGSENNRTGLGAIFKLLLGSGFGAIASQTIKPDLRCWRNNFDNLQVKRVILPEGKYQISIVNPYGYPGTIDKQVKINSGKNTYILLRNF